MSQRLQDSSSSSHSNSPKWITDFKEKPQTPPLDSSLSQNTPPGLDGKEMQAITKRGEMLPQPDPYTFDLDLDETDSIELPENDVEDSDHLDRSAESDPLVHPADSILPSIVTEDSFDPHVETFESPLEESPPKEAEPQAIESSVEPAVVEGPPSREQSPLSEITDESLELFQDLRPVKIVPPPRPPPPTRPPPPVTSGASSFEEHPLMMRASPEPPIPAQVPRSNFREKLSKSRERFSSLKQRLQPPEKDEIPGSVSPESFSTGTTPPDSIDIAISPPPPIAVPPGQSSETESNMSSPRVTTRDKFRKFKKKGSTYIHDWKDWYYGKGNKDQQLQEEKTPSESSDFQEITADDVADTDTLEGVELPTADHQPPSSQRMSQISPQIDIVTVPSSMSSSRGSNDTPTWVLLTVVSVVVLLVALVAQFCSPYCQGVLTGLLLPCLVYGVAKYYSWRRISATVERGPIPTRRSILTKTTLEGFFHYTETRNFGELNFKRMPYRFVKVVGTEVEVYETGRSGSTFAPCLDDLDSIELKLSFKLDISGWDVSVEPLPGTVLTVHNKWRKKYPIWIRRPTWRVVNTDSYDNDTLLDVPSFYLFAVYSRDKEYWYEELKKRSLLTNPEGGKDADNYLNHMTRIFNQIPHEETTFLPKDSVTIEEGELEEGGTEESSPTTAAVDGASSSSEVTTEVAWINAFFGRFCWNIMADQKWEKRIRDRIVRKLSGVQTRYIYSLALKSFDLGDTVPLITKTYQPKIDEQGVWSEMDMKWTGVASLTLVAKLNASKDKGSNSNTSEQMRLEPTETKPSSTPSRLSRLYNFLDRLEVVVSARVTSFSGRLCVNISPPPTDCVWYGFKEPPVYNLQLEPVLWKISLEYPFVTKKIEKQLRILFNETFVLPAMENIVIPGMSRSMELKPADRPTLDQLLDVATAS